MTHLSEILNQLVQEHQITVTLDWSSFGVSGKGPLLRVHGLVGPTPTLTEQEDAVDRIALREWDWRPHAGTLGELVFEGPRPSAFVYASWRGRPAAPLATLDGVLNDARAVAVRLGVTLEVVGAPPVSLGRVVQSARQV